MVRGLVRLLMTFSLLLFIAGCASVEPWERDLLALDEMAWEPDPVAARLNDHILFSKEASSGGAAAAGGGCGCN